MGNNNIVFFFTYIINYNYLLLLLFCIDTNFICPAVIDIGRVYKNKK